MRFAIFTHVEHREREGRYYAYAPYVREMNIWLRHVEEVEVVGTRRLGDVGTKGLGDLETGRKKDLGTRGLGGKETGRKGDLETGGVGENGIPYEHSKLTFTEVPDFNFLNFPDAIKAIIRIPYIFFKIFGAMQRADHLHLRCPGNMGLLACIFQIFFPSKPKSAKYAGNWDPKAKQPWTYRFQKWVLSNTFLTRNMQVLVYGEWPGQSKNVIPFFTASFAEEEIAEVPEKTFSEPFIFLFVGNLVEGKRPLEAIKLVQELIDKIYARLEIYGNGSERKKIEKYVTENQLENVVIFKGSRPLEELKKAYQKAHFVILPSRSEGWPKAIAEGMFFGCIPIATPVSCVPRMVNYGSRGVLLEDLSQRQTANGQQLIANGSKEWSMVRGQDVLKIKQLLADQEEMKRMSEEAKKWSQQYTLEKFEAAIQEVLQESNEKKIMENRKLSPAPFRGGAKRGKREK